MSYFLFSDGKFHRNNGTCWREHGPHLVEIAPLRLVTRVEPIDPAPAQDDGVAGTVVLRVKIQIGNRPIVEAVVSEDEGLVQAAKDRVRQWRFEPASVNDKPVEGETIRGSDFVPMRA